MLVRGLRDIFGNFVGSNMGTGDTVRLPLLDLTTILSRLTFEPVFSFVALIGIRLSAEAVSQAYKEINKLHSFRKESKHISMLPL